MSDFIIPKGKDFAFTIKVIEKDSFLPQDLTNMLSATIDFFSAADGCKVHTVTLVVVDALNGVLKGTMPPADTNLFIVDRGAKEDGYYLKANYQGAVTVTFSDTTQAISTLISKVYVSPTGVVCA